MAHQIDESNNRANMAYVGKVPWHGLGQQMDDDLRVARGLEDLALLLEVAAQRCGVDQVSVVGDGDLSVGEFKQKRVGIGVAARTGRRLP